MKSLINHSGINKSGWMTLAAALLCNTPSYAQSQGAGNGGDVQRSSIADVLKVIHEVTAEPTDPVWLNSNGYGYWVESESIYRNFFDLPEKESQAVLQKLFVLEDTAPGFFHTAIYHDLKSTKIEIRTSSRCPVINSDELSIAASTPSTRGAPICLDAKALATIPKEDLMIQVKGLLAHEFTHHFGFGEAAANRVQSIMIRHCQKTVGRARKRLAYAIQGMQRTFVRLEQNSKIATATPAVLCADIGMLMGIYQEIQDLNEMLALTTQRETGTEAYSVEWEKLESLQNKLKSLATFCGDYYVTSDQWGTQSLQYSRAEGNGDRNLLAQSLALFKAVFKPLFESITQQIWSDL